MNRSRTAAPCGALRHLLLIVLTGALAMGCGDDSRTPGPGANHDASASLSDGGASGDAATPLPDQLETSGPPAVTCDASRRPIVFAHGFLASGDTFANHAMRFGANGYCLDRIVAFDWNTLDQDNDNAGDLDVFIDLVLAETGADQVDLAGHSAGGNLGYTYLSTPERAAKVAHYAHIGSQGQDGPAGPDGEVPTLNLWSDGDTIIDTKGDIEGATNVMLSGADHYAVATNAASFDALYRFFQGDQAPTTTDIAPRETRTLYGKVLSLGENLVGAGTTVDIHACDPETGFRQSETPDASLITDAGGHWGPFEAAEATPYEFHVYSDDTEDRPVHYYFEPFERSNSLVYLRTLPGPGSLAGELMSSLPQPDTASTVVVFSASHAMLEGVDSLTFGETELLTTESATADDTLLALFLFDANENGESDWSPAVTFGFIPFLNGTDVHIPAGEAESVAFTFNGRVIKTRNWSTGLDGPIIVVFR